MFFCKYCPSTTAYQVFKPFENPHRTNPMHPKYAFHISEVCAECHKFQQHLKQTPELIEGMKGRILMAINLEPRDIGR